MFRILILALIVIAFILCGALCLSAYVQVSTDDSYARCGPQMVETQHQLASKHLIRGIISIGAALLTSVVLWYTRKRQFPFRMELLISILAMVIGSFFLLYLSSCVFGSFPYCFASIEDLKLLDKQLPVQEMNSVPER